MPYIEEYLVREQRDFRPFYTHYKPIEKRVPQKINNQWKITYYGYNNLYPQEQKQIRLESPLIKSCTKVKRNVIFGAGFENEAKGTEVINDFGQTWNDLLWLACDDWSIYQGFGIFSNFNGLGDIVNPVHTPFEFIRYGEPDDFGRHNDAKISNNWEQEGNRFPRGTDPAPIKVNLWNPRFVQDDVINRGEGQLFYKVPHIDQYPESSLDAVWRLGKAEGEVQRFELSNLVNGFLGGVLVKVPQDSFESENEAQSFVANINQMIGSNNAGRVFGLLTPDELIGQPLIEAITTSVEPALFVETVNHIVRSILQNYQMPAALVGENIAGGFIQEAQYRDGWKVANMTVHNERKMIEQCFNQLDPTLGKIKPLEFTNQSPNQNGANQFNENNDESVNPEGEEEDA